MGAHILVVLYHQDGLGSDAARRVYDRLRLRRRLVASQQPRQVELHRRAHAGLAVELHVATRLLDEAVDLAEAEAGALADILGGVERLESARLDLARHATAGIGDRYHHVLAG